jgi:hypothetical protein
MNIATCIGGLSNLAILMLTEMGIIWEGVQMKEFFVTLAGGYSCEMIVTLGVFGFGCAAKPRRLPAWD